MKAFYFLITIFLLIHFSSFSQDNDTKTRTKKIPKHKTVLSIGITASPDIYIYDFKKYPDFQFDYKYKFNYSAGLTVVYYPVKFISIRASALYSTKGFSLDYNYTNSSPNLTPPDSIAVQTNLVADYLDVPIVLHLNIIHKDRIQLFLAGGVVPGFLIKKSQNTIFKNKSERTTDDISKTFNEFIAGAIYSIGFKYNLSAKFGIGVDPYLRYYFNKIDKQSMAVNPVSIGGKVSLYYNFIHKHHKHHWGK
jgi:hypothetical protein